MSNEYVFGETKGTRGVDESKDCIKPNEENSFGTINNDSVNIEQVNFSVVLKVGLGVLLFIIILVILL